MNDAKQLADPLPCPFCGGAAKIFRIGDRHRSTQYNSTMCGCFLETGEEWNHGAAWNRRVPDPEVLRLTAERDAAVDKYEAADGMDGAVTCAIREMLNTQDVPKAAFIDDHVGNALIQRLQYRAEVISLTAAHATLTVRVKEARKALEGLRDAVTAEDKFGDRALTITGSTANLKWLLDADCDARAWLAGKDGAL